MTRSILINSITGKVGQSNHHPSPVYSDHPAPEQSDHPCFPASERNDLLTSNNIPALASRNSCSTDNNILSLTIIVFFIHYMSGYFKYI